MWCWKDGHIYPLHKVIIGQHSSILKFANSYRLYRYLAHVESMWSQ